MEFISSKLLKAIKNQRVFITLVGSGFLLLSLNAILNGFEQRTNSQQNTQHWVWQQRDLAFAESSDGLVIMQGEYQTAGEQVLFTKKGLTPYKVAQPIPVRLLIRAYQLPPIDEMIKQIEYLRYHWQLAGTAIAGVQLDYDSPAAKLAQYRHYISQLSQHFGVDYISITGLSSWLADNIDELNQFAGVIDYVAIQFYQRYQPVPQAAQLSRRLSQLKLPFKIGITTAPRFKQLSFARNRYYRGKLIFTNVRKLV